MNELHQKISLAMQAIWRRRWVAAGVAWAVGLLGMAVVALVPNRYEAVSRVYVDTQSVLKPLMQGLAFQPDIDQQVRMMAKTVVSRPNVERLLALPGVTPQKVSQETHEQMIDSLIAKIKFDHSGGNLYVVSYRDKDPERARAIVAGLVSLFVDNGVDSKARDSEEASSFIDAQIKSYEAKLAESENRLKDFKIRNFGVTGVSNQDYYARTSALADEAGRLRIALTAAEQGRDALRRELASEDPRLPAEAMQVAGPPAMPSELDTRIETQRKLLDELLRRYTDEHPDVVNAKRIIAQLETQRRSEQEAIAKGTEKRQGAATSPVYQRIRVSLAEAEANVASLRSQLGAQQSRLDAARATANKVPQAEAELAQLNRDYDVVRKNYDMLVSRREAATMGVKLDKSSQLADFRIVEPPRVAPKAVFPDRLALAAGALLLALAAGIGVAYGLSAMAPAFMAARALQDFTKRPTLGSIGVHATPDARVAGRRDVFRFAGVIAAFVIVQVAWIAWVSVHAVPLS